MVVAPFFIKPIYNMFEKVSPSHPDKLADRIAGAIVDLAYTKAKNPRIATEVLLGHGECNIQVETSEQISAEDIEAIVERIAGEGIETRALIVPQDIHLAANQQHGVRCGDNGIFKGCPPTEEQRVLTAIAATIYGSIPYDGKYIINENLIRKYNAVTDEVEVVSNPLTICQSHVENKWDIMDIIFKWIEKNPGYSLFQNITVGDIIINPLGPWTGGIDVDCGCTNRKLGSDMGDGVTGGGLHGKDLSRADVSVNIVCHLLAVRYGEPIEACCSIGDEEVTFNGYYSLYAHERNLPKFPITMAFADIVEQARLYIHTLGGFEKFAEWGLIRAKDL